MILTVTHTTLYRYDAPVRGVVQSHRLTPSAFDGQKVRDWRVEVSGGVAGGRFRDGAGDWVQGYSVPGPVSEITVHVEGTVETCGPCRRAARPPRDGRRPTPICARRAITRADAALTALADAATGGAIDPLDRAHRLSAAVGEAIAYRPGATHAHTTAAEALALGEGVCQDHAHALIAAARAIGLPARYVSGYLMAAEDGMRHEAAHAWAEIWIEGLGCWVGFDAANACCPDDRYIRLGSGYDARDAAPIRGTARGTGGESLDVTVAIQSVQQ